MNSALQCLVNCEALADYFLGFNWKGEINKWVRVRVRVDPLHMTDEWICPSVIPTLPQFVSLLPELCAGTTRRCT